MLSNRFKTEESNDNGSDPRLTALLREWKDIKPAANFESAVWSNIRTASGIKAERIIFGATLREWFAPRPAWVSATAAAAGIVAGISLAFSTAATRSSHADDDPLLESQTLAGSYIAMVTGGIR